MAKPLIELCVEGIDGFLAAQDAGADRVELCASLVEGGLTPIHSVEELGAMGYRVVLYANTALRAGMLAVRSALATLRAEGSSRSLADRLVSWEERQRLVGKPAIDELEGRYADPDHA